MKEKIRSFLSSKDEANRKRAAQDRLFNPEYIDFDDFGHTEVRCMRCGTSIMARTEIPTHDPGVRVLGMKKLANYRQIDRTGKATILCCVQCEPELATITPDDEDRLETVHMHGWTAGMVFAGKSDDYIKEFVRRRK